MTNPLVTAPLNWFVSRRLDYISWRLAAIGELRRADIMRVFGVSMPQASQDIAAFEAAHPGASLYDKSAKLYRANGRHAARKRLSGIDWAAIDSP